MHPDVEKYLPLLESLAYDGWQKLAVAVEVEFAKERQEQGQGLRLPRVAAIHLRRDESGKE